MGRRPPDAVNTRTLTAEACASAALAMIQNPAVWDALTTLALITETAEARRSEGLHAVGEAILDVLQEIQLSDADADRAMMLITAVDSTARTWAAVAHPS